MASQSRSVDAASVLSATVFTYDAADRLVKTSVSLTGGGSSNSLSLYDSTGRLVGSVDGEGFLTQYEYTKTNQLARTTRYATKINATALANALGNTALATLALLKPAANAAADQVSYKVYDAADRLVKQVDAEGAVVEHVYDGTGRLVQTLSRATLLSATQRSNLDRKSTRLNSSHATLSRMPSSA